VNNLSKASYPDQYSFFVLEMIKGKITGKRWKKLEITDVFRISKLDFVCIDLGRLF